MNEALQQLEDDLAAATSNDERITILNREAGNLSRVDPGCGLRLAKRALNIAAANHNIAGQSESYCTIGICHVYLANHSRAVSSFRKAYRLAERANDNRGRGRALANLGVVLIRADEYPQALQVLMQGLEIFEVYSDDNARSFLSMIKRNLGVLYGDIGDYTKSLEYYHQSLRIKETLGELVAGDLNNIGTTFYTMGDMQQARRYFQEALDQYCAKGDRFGEAMALGNIAEMERQEGKYKESRDSYSRALKLWEELGDRSSALYALLGVAANDRQMGEFDAAHMLVQQGRELAEALDVPRRLLEVHIEEAELLIAAGDMAEAAEAFCTIVKMADELGDPGPLKEAHGHLSRIYENLGNIEQAFFHHKEQDRIRSEIMGQEKQREITMMQMRYEVEKAEQEREMLKLKNQRLELEMQHKMKELTALAMQLVHKNEMLDELKKQIGELVASKNGTSESSKELTPLLRQIDTSRNSEQEWEVFEQQFRALHPEFMDQLARQCSELSPTELKVCALLKINLATKDIANILCCSVRTIEDHRYRIRIKLDLPKSVNLTSHLVGIGWNSSVQVS